MLDLISSNTTSGANYSTRIKEFNEISSFTLASALKVNKPKVDNQLLSRANALLPSVYNTIQRHFPNIVIPHPKISTVDFNKIPHPSNINTNTYSGLASRISANSLEINSNPNSPPAQFSDDELKRLIAHEMMHLIMGTRKGNYISSQLPEDLAKILREGGCEKLVEYAGMQPLSDNKSPIYNSYKQKIDDLVETINNNYPGKGKEIFTNAMLNPNINSNELKIVINTLRNL